MSTQVKVGGFAVALLVLFGAAFGIGRLFDDERSDDGYRLRLSSSQAEPSTRVALSFAVLDPDEKVVTDFAVKHEKRLHLIAVAKDFGGYRHLHPTMSPSGTWSIDADLSGGAWRLYADFQPVGGEDEVATADLDVAGTRASGVADPEGFDVQVAGKLRAGSEGSTLTFTVRDANGRPVTDLEPYLGSYGHLVAIREDDLGYLHVHPEQGPAGPEVAFHVEVPEAGSYRLFLDFKHDGTVHTAPFEVEAVEGADGTDHGMHHGDH